MPQLLTRAFFGIVQRIEEMHAVIQDLEALKELNDELEENHIENEKQMQEELGTSRPPERKRDRGEPAADTVEMCRP